MSAEANKQPDDSGGRFGGWTDPRYAGVVARIEAARRGRRLPRGFVFELPKERRPPAA
ncbi:hypothetical protein ACWGIB_22245 [Streptomyces xiamenensis]